MSFGILLVECGGSYVYAGIVIFLSVLFIFIISIVEYMYTSPHIRSMKAFPLQDTRILRILQEIAVKFRIAPPRAYITHYEVPNAFTLGRRSDAALIITDGLLDLSYDEVKAVIAHELAHVKANDSLIKTVASVMKRFLFFDVVTRFVYSRIYVEKEFVADERSARIMGRPQDLISALRKIYKEVSEVGVGLPSKSVLNYSQTIYGSDALRQRQGIPQDPIVRNRFIVERKMMPGSVVQERVRRLTEMEKKLKKAGRRK